jgi:hypothetical protein
MIDTATKDIKIMMRLVPITFEFMGLAFRNRFVQKSFKEYINRYLGILIPIIQYGIDNGEFRQGDPKDIAIAVGAMIEGTLLLWVYDKNIVDPEKHVRSGLKILLDGILYHN